MCGLTLLDNIHKEFMSNLNIVKYILEHLLLGHSEVNIVIIRM